MTMTDWILVTGQLSSGKTTAVKKMVQFLESHGFECRGFFTDEVLDEKKKNNKDNNTRIGFDVVTVPDGKRGVLSRVEGLPSNYPKTGKYRVDVESFERLALPSLSIPDDGSGDGGGGGGNLKSNNGRNREKLKKMNNSDKPIILVLDEIGRMELHSKEFPQHVRDLLSKGVRLVGAITAPRYGHRVPFCDEIATHDSVQVHNLTKKTRDDITDKLLQYIQGSWIEK